MPKPCTICDHPQVKEINYDIVNGVSLRKMGDKYRIHFDAIGRHARNEHHIPKPQIIKYDPEISEEVKKTIELNIKDITDKAPKKPYQEMNDKDKELNNVIRISKGVIGDIIRRAKDSPDYPNQYNLIPQYLRVINDSVKLKIYMDFQPLQIEAKRINPMDSDEMTESKKWLEKLIDKSRVIKE